MQIPKQGGSNRKFFLFQTMLCLLPFAGKAAASQKAEHKDAAWMTTVIKLQGKAVTFAGGIRTLSDQTGLPMMADGEPDLKSCDFDLATAAKEALDKFCDKFDYYWTESKQGTILLRKRFRNPDELPQMHIAEMRQMTRDIVRVLTVLRYDRNPDHVTDIMRQLYANLTADQLNALRARRRVFYRDLSAQQHALIEQAILTHSLAINLDNWVTLNDQFLSIPNVSLRGNIPQNRLLDQASSSAPYSLLFRYSRYPPSKGANGGVLLLKRDVALEAQKK
jgi:hypothetical protein